jgi:hypothetical protein
LGCGAGDKTSDRAAERKGDVTSGSLFMPPLRPVDLQIQFDRTCPSLTDGLFCTKPMTSFPLEISKIGRSMPIVAETEQIADRRNSPLNSRAQFFDGSERRFFLVRRRNLRSHIKGLLWPKTIEWE